MIIVFLTIRLLAREFVALCLNDYCMFNNKITCKVACSYVSMIIVFLIIRLLFPRYTFFFFLILIFRFGFDYLWNLKDELSHDETSGAEIERFAFIKSSLFKILIVIVTF